MNTEFAANAPMINESGSNLNSNPGELAAYLQEAFERNGAIDVDRADPKLWIVALNELVENSKLDAAKFAMPRLASAYPDFRYFATAAAVLARLPASCEGAGRTAFHDNGEREVQVVPHSGASTVLLGFCGTSKKMGLSLNLIHRWLGHLGVHVIYLRDFNGGLYDHGIRSLAADLSGTLQALRKICDNLCARHVVCYGNSIGGYGALRYALELQADAILSLASPTNLVPGFATSLPGAARRRVKPGLDLRPLYQGASRVPRTHLVYSQNNIYDRAQALNFFGLPKVSFEMLPGVTVHNVVLHLICQERYQQLIRWLVDQNRTLGIP
jgi:pimeloyl-ACP methyl ester carboxylesterase